MSEPALDPGAPVSGRAFAWFRLGLGLYLLLRFLGLIPYAGELFSREGTIPDPGLNLTHGILPNPLTVWDQPWQVQVFLGALAAGALLFALGVQRRPLALALAYGAACLFDRNNLISNPSLPYVGSLLLLSATIPAREPWRLFGSPSDEEFYFPRWTLRTAWLLLALGYTFSGLDKLSSAPSWGSGEALRFVLELPLARPTTLRELLLSAPPELLRLATWGALAVEVLCLPLCLFRRGRLAAWVAATGLQIGILFTLGFAELTLGMLLVHWFVLLPGWRAFWERSPSSPAEGSGSRRS